MLSLLPTNRTVLPVGATVRLPCGAGAHDPPGSVGWLKDGRALVGVQPRASLLENGTLQITGLRVSRPQQGHPRGYCREGGGSGCKGSSKGTWMLMVVGASHAEAKGGGYKVWWVLRVVGAEVMVAQGDGAGALPPAGERLRALQVRVHQPSG